MVERFVPLAATIMVNLLAEVERTPLSRLPPLTRFKIIGGLILLTIGGVALVVLSWMMLRAGRRALHRDTRGTQRAHPVERDDWAKHPMSPDPNPPLDTE